MLKCNFKKEETSAERVNGITDTIKVQRNFCMIKQSIYNCLEYCDGEDKCVLYIIYANFRRS
jgi:hypothetical protein